MTHDCLVVLLQAADLPCSGLLKFSISARPSGHSPHGYLSNGSTWCEASEHLNISSFNVPTLSLGLPRLRVNQVFPRTRISVCWFLHSKFHCFQNAKVQCNLETASLARPSAKLTCRCPTVPTPVNSCGARQGKGSFHNKARLVSMAFWDSSIILGTDEHSFQCKH